MPNKIEQNSDAINNLRYIFCRGDKKTSKIKQINLFNSKKTDPIYNIKTLINNNDPEKPMKVKDALLIKSVLDRKIKKEKTRSKTNIFFKPFSSKGLSSKGLSSDVNNLLIKADFSLPDRNPDFECTADLRLETKENSNYQDKVSGQIKRDYGRVGISIVNECLIENSATQEGSDKNIVETELIKSVAAKYPNINETQIKEFVQQAMIIGTQHVINDAYIQYTAEAHYYPKTELQGITRFSVDDNGIQMERETVYEEQQSKVSVTAQGKLKKKNIQKTETVFHATASMAFKKHLEKDTEFPSPQNIPVNVKVYTKTEDIH